jgi:adenylate kinase family enzyme
MKKILIFGNSASGKSTLAQQLSRREGLSHLDLDLLAWEPTITPPVRKSLDKSNLQIQAFINSHRSWVIEGCYTDLLKIASPFSTEIVYMNLPIDQCVENAKNRPWEPHKYESKEVQDSNLAMLIDWIAQYATRTDTFSEHAHRQFYDQYSGRKMVITQNQIPNNDLR